MAISVIRSSGLVLGALLLCSGCSGKEPPSPSTPTGGPGPTVAPPPAATAEPTSTATATDLPSTPPDPPAEDAAASKGGVRITYLMGIPFGPCNKLLKTYVKKAQGYEVETQCQMPPGKASTRAIDAQEFDSTVYAKTRLSPTGPTDPKFHQIGMEQVEGGAPKGTTRCYRSANQANTFCENAQGIITMSSFDGRKLKPPKRDANRGYELVKVEGL